MTENERRITELFMGADEQTKEVMLRMIVSTSKFGDTFLEELNQCNGNRELMVRVIDKYTAMM